jgi:hypothetical protein
MNASSTPYDLRARHPGGEPHRIPPATAATQVTRDLTSPGG